MNRADLEALAEQATRPPRRAQRVIDALATGGLSLLSEPVSRHDLIAFHNAASPAVVLVLLRRLDLAEQALATVLDTHGRGHQHRPVADQDKPIRNNPEHVKRLTRQRDEPRERISQAEFRERYDLPDDTT